MFKQILAALLAVVAAAAFANVDINKANQAELEAVKGLGTVTTGRILEERQRGSFKDWSDVMQRVHGIKQGKASRLSSAGLTVNGESYHGPDKADGKQGKGKKSGFKLPAAKSSAGVSPASPQAPAAK